MDIQDMLLTLAQIIATLSGLFAIFVFQRIAQVRDIMVGDGKAHLRREDKKNEKHTEINIILKEENKVKIDLDRLKDAIDRKNLQGIREAIYKADYLEIRAHIAINNDEDKIENNAENRKKYDLCSRDENDKLHKGTGYFHNVRPRFDESLAQLESIKSWLYGIVVLFFFSIFFIFFFLLVEDFCQCVWSSLVIIGLLFFILILLSFVVWKSLFEDMPHEKEKKKVCEKVNKLINEELINEKVPKRNKTYRDPS